MTSGGVIVATSVSELPKSIDMYSLFSVTDVIPVTVTMQLELKFDPSVVVAVMVAVPGPTPWMLPFWSTVTIDELFDAHERTEWGVLLGDKVAISVSSPPT